MKIQLDFDNKLIKIEDKVNLDKFFKVIKQMLPNNEWKKYSLESVTIIQNWSNPIVVQPYYVPYRPYNWPWITYGTINNPDHTKLLGSTTTAFGSTNLNNKTTSNQFSLKNDASGTYNIEIP